MDLRNIKAFDYFSSNYTLVFQGKEFFQTKIGGIITALTILLFILFAFYLGQELIYKSKPNDNPTTEVSSTPPNLTFTIPVAFLIELDNGSAYSELDSLIQVKSTYYDTFNLEGIFVDNQTNNIAMRKCNHSDFSPELNSSYHIMNLDEAVCMENETYQLGGDFSGNFSKYIEVDIVPCKNTTSYNSCFPLENRTSILNSHSLGVAIHYESLSYTSENFGNPVKKILMQNNYIFEPSVCKIYYYYVHQLIILSESGFLFYNFEKQVYHEFEYIKSDFYMNQPGEDCLIKFVFQSSFYTRIQTRTYLTFSSVVAQVGGALNAYLLIFSVIFKYLYKKKMNEKIIRRLFSDHQGRDNFLINSSPAHPRNSIFAKKRIKSVILEHSAIKNYKQEQEFKKPESVIEVQNLNPSIFLKSKRTDYKFIESNNTEANLMKESNLKLPEPLSLNQNENLTSEQNNNYNFKIQLKDRIQGNLDEAFFAERQKLQNIIDKKENDLRLNTDAVFLKKKSTNSEVLDKSVSRLRFTLFDHFCFSFCTFLVSEKKLRLKENYEELILFSYRYLDIVNVVKKLHEFERMKFILFDKRQLALFNSISQPSNPLIQDENKMNVMAERLKFENDIEHQKGLIEEILKNKEEFLTDKVNIRLIKFYFNIID